MLESQIVFLPKLFLKVGNQKVNIKLVTFIILAYILYMRKYLIKDYGCIKQNNGIHLKWWNYENATIYVVTWILLSILLKISLD